MSLQRYSHWSRIPSLTLDSPEFLPLLTYFPDERGLLTPPRARLFVLPIPLRQCRALLRGTQRGDIAHKRGRTSESVRKPTARVEYRVFHPQATYLRYLLL